jgi:hypothetical protein
MGFSPSHAPPLAWALVLAIVALASGCGPSVGTADGSQSGDADATTSDDATRGDDAEGGVEVGSDPSVDTTSPAEDTGNDFDECLLADPSACPENCAAGYALQVIDDACGTSSVEACIPGGPKPGVPPTTYWALAPSGPMFLEYGGACGAGAQPATWTECSGAADEPTECACFCQQGYCRGDEDRRALDECGLATPCAPLYADSELGVFDHEIEQCVLQGLRDGVPGVYEVGFVSGFSSDTTRYYVFGSEVARIEMHIDDIIQCPLVSDWSVADRCTLQSTEFFATCMMPASTEGECIYLVDEWVLDCATEPPACG